MLKKSSLIFLIISILSLTVVETVFSATSGNTTTTVGINPGSLSLTAPATATFASVTLDGTVQTTTADLTTVGVTDATGSGNGWRVTVGATQFTEVGGAGLTLPTGSLSLASPSTVTADGTTSPVPTIQTGPFVIDNGSAATILSAAVNEGMGKYNVNFPVGALTLTLNPATTKVDTVNYPSVATPFETTVTFTVVSGP